MDFVVFELGYEFEQSVKIKEVFCMGLQLICFDVVWWPLSSHAFTIGDLWRNVLRNTVKIWIGWDDRLRRRQLRHFCLEKL